jgi:hypothetical protein
VLRLASGEEYKLTTGKTVTGELLTATANDQGVKIKVGEGEYETVPWNSFSQDDIKTFAKNAKLLTFVEPFVEVTQAERAQKKEVTIKLPPRLERPAKQSLFGAMFSSGLGIFIMFLIYAGNIYAGYEVSIFRGRPALLVCGLAAIPVLGFVATIVFLSIPTAVQASTPATEVPIEANVEAAAVAGGEEAVNPMQGDAAQPGGLHLHTEAPAAKAAEPQVTTFQRGQFTFNRRFFETKFAAFFGVVRREADKNLELVIKSARGQYKCERITRIAAADVHVQVQKGHVSEEVLIPFTEIQEIQLTNRPA